MPTTTATATALAKRGKMWLSARLLIAARTLKQTVLEGIHPLVCNVTKVLGISFEAHSHFHELHSSFDILNKTDSLLLLLTLFVCHSCTHTYVVSIMAGWCSYNDLIFPDRKGAISFVCHTKRREAAWVQVDHLPLQTYPSTMVSSHRLPMST